LTTIQTAAETLIRLTKQGIHTDTALVFAGFYGLPPHGHHLKEQIAVGKIKYNHQ
jgi:hypothetical protein